MAKSSRIYAPRRVSRVATRPHGIILSVIVAVVLIVVSVVASTSVYARTLISNVNERTQTIDSGIDTTRPVMDDGELNLLYWVVTNDRKIKKPAKMARAQTRSCLCTYRKVTKKCM